MSEESRAPVGAMDVFEYSMGAVHKGEVSFQLRSFRLPEGNVFCHMDAEKVARFAADLMQKAFEAHREDKEKLASLARASNSASALLERWMKKGAGHGRMGE